MSTQSTSENPIDSVPEAVKAAPWQFQKGNQLGRKGGRPKLDTVVRQAFRAQGLESLQVLIELRDNKKTPANVRLAACNSILDRGFGKPREAPETIDDSNAVDMSESDILSLLGVAG